MAGRLAALGSVGGVALVSALMLLAPVSSATAITKPFKGFTSGTNYGVSKSGCGTGKITKLPVFTKRTGLFKAGSKESAPACRSSPTSNYGDTSIGVNVMGPVKFATSGNHTLTAVWKVTAVMSENATPYAGCVFTSTVVFQACITDSYAELYAYVFMTDQSNSTWGTYGYGFAIGGFVSVFNSTFSELSNSGNFTSGGNASFSGTTWLNSTLNLSGTSAINKTDKFTIQVTLYAFGYASAYVYNGAKGVGKASASSMIDIGSAGHGALLQGIVIT